MIYILKHSGNIYLAEYYFTAQNRSQRFKFVAKNCPMNDGCQEVLNLKNNLSIFIASLFSLILQKLFPFFSFN